MGDTEREIGREIAAQMTDIVDNYLEFEELSMRRRGHHEGLTVSEAHLIEKVGPQGGVSMGEAAARLGVTTGTLTVAVSRLEKKGFIQRERSQDDRRVVLLRLTRRGMAANRLHDRFHRSMVQSVTQSLDGDEQRSFVKALKTLNGFLREAIGRPE